MRALVKKATRYRIIIKTVRIITTVSGLFLLFLTTLAFTHIPFHIYHSLGTPVRSNDINPDYIIVLGGGGMPSASALMRSYYAGIAGNKFPQAHIIIALPGDTITPYSSVLGMKTEIELRGIEADMISIETTGQNTRAQALALQQRLAGKDILPCILLVTSPEHMKRAVLTFKKTGLQCVGSFPAFEFPLEAELKFDDADLGGNSLFVPQIGRNIAIRYRFWKHLEYEVMIIRELFALSYYKLRGWI